MGLDLSSLNLSVLNGGEDQRKHGTGREGRQAEEREQGRSPLAQGSVEARRREVPVVPSRGREVARAAGGPW